MRATKERKLNVISPWMALALAALAGCQAGASNTEHATAEEDPTVGNEALGIAEFETTETENDLVIRGLDGKGETVAEYRIHTGTVELEEDWEARSVVGRRAEMIIEGRKYVHASEGMEPISLLFWGHESDELVQDPYVRRVLARWGITYRYPIAVERDPDEVAFSDWCQEDYGTAPCGGGGGSVLTLCATDSDVAGYEQHYRCSAFPTRHWMRLCHQVQGGICGPVGPLGCASCGYWVADPPYDAECFGEMCSWTM
jgi:hypothetical protein